MLISHITHAAQPISDLFKVLSITRNKRFSVLMPEYVHLLLIYDALIDVGIINVSAVSATHDKLGLQLLRCSHTLQRRTIILTIESAGVQSVAELSVRYSSNYIESVLRHSDYEACLTQLRHVPV